MKDRFVNLWVYVFIGLCFGFSILNTTVLYAQEENTDKDKITDLPPVKIEIVDITQINIPREKFRSFTEPESKVYKPFDTKERPWYFPDTSIPEKLKDESTKAGKSSLLTLSAQVGLPVDFLYQLLLVKGFGDFESMLDLGRTTLKTGRTPDKQGDSNSDNLRGSIAYKQEKFNLRTEAQYNSKDIDYTGKAGEILRNDRALSRLLANFGLVPSKDTLSSLSLNIESLRMKGPISSGEEKGLEVETDLKIKTDLPESNPVEFGIGSDYFVGSSDIEDFKETIIRLYFRDNDIRIWAFVLGIGAELLVDVYKNSNNSEGWKFDPYVNPYLLLTSRIGNRTIFQLGLERYLLRQNLKDLYIDKDGIRFNPCLNPEGTWELSAGLQYRMAGRFTGSVKAFDKEIKKLSFFEKYEDAESDMLSWRPIQRDIERILGFAMEYELFLISNQLKNDFHFIHESYNVKIPYRSRNRGTITLTYFAPSDFELSLSAEFFSRRYTKEDTNDLNTDVPYENTTTDDGSLPSYILWKPKITKKFGKYTSAFLTLGLYTGSEKYEIWKGYELPKQTVDVGVKFKF